MIAAYHGRRVLVLGAGGFIGRWVARALSSPEVELLATARDPGATEPVAARWGIRGPVRALDCGDRGAVIGRVRDWRPEVVFNLVGYGVDRSERDEAPARLLNDELPGWLCEAMAVPGGARARLVHVGSALEYGTLDGDLDEASTPAPTTLYGRTKLAGTRRVEDARAAGDVEGVTARLFTVYGPGEHAGRLLPSLLEAAGGSAPLDLTAGGQRRDFTYVEDVVEGLLRLGAAPGASPPVVNLATGVLTPVRRFVEIAAEVLGISVERLRFGRIPTRREEMRHDPVSIERLRRYLDWSPETDIETGVRRTLGFLRGGVDDPGV